MDRDGDGSRSRSIDDRLSTYSVGSQTYAALYSLAYLVTATVLIMANKHLITETAFGCPIFISSLGSWFGWLVSAAAIHYGFVELDTKLTFGEWVSSILPLGAATALSLASANVAYFYLSLSFIQMLKAFAPVVTYFTLVAFGLDRFSSRIMSALSVVMLGCFVASWGEAHVTIFGMLCMLVAEVAEAFRSVGVQYLIANKRFSLFSGMYYFSPATLVFLMGLSLLFETEELFKSRENLHTLYKYWYLFMICATFGFAVNYVCLGVVKHAGSLMVKTMSQLKNVFVIAAATFLYGDKVSTLEICGYAVAVIGFIGFNHAKALDAAAVREQLKSDSMRESEVKPLIDK